MKLRALLCAAILADSAAAWAAPPKAKVSPEPLPTRRKGSLEVSVDGGVAFVSHDFRSNGQTTPGSFSDYDFAAQGVALRVGLAYDYSLGEAGRIGFDGSYQFSGLTSVNVPAYVAGQASGTASLSLQSHNADLALTGGVHLNALGGTEIRLRVGGALLANFIEPNSDAPLPSEETIGLLLGARIALPSFAHLGSLPLGVRAEGAYIGVTTHHQNAGLEDGASADAHAITFHAELSLGLIRAVQASPLALTLGYHLASETIDYSGPSVRNDSTHGNVSDAHRELMAHTVALGLRYTY